MDKSLVREIKKIAVGVSVLGIIMAIVLLIFWGVNAPMLWGTLLGCGYAIFNFCLTAYFVSQSVKKSENGAKAYMAGGYYLRLALAAAMIFMAIKLPCFNVFTTAIPLVFPRIVITLNGLIKVKKSGGGDA